MIKEFWIEYEYKIILSIGFLLVAAISFEFGYMQAGTINSSPIIIEKPAVGSEISPEGRVSSIMESESAVTQKAPVVADLPATAGQANCAFVGSKNSNKYYPPTCSYAKRIKPENLVCFKTAQEALAQGRIISSGCKY